MRSPALVDTLSRLLTTSPKAAVMIAMKVRHYAENVFFDLIVEAGLKVSHCISLPLPGDAESGEETVDVYLLQYGKADHLPEVTPSDACLGL